MATATKTFQYRTVDSSGKYIKGTVAAANEAAAAQLLRQRGEVALSMTEKGKGLQREVRIPGLGGRTTLRDLAVFARQFATMTASGMSLLRSLAILEDQSSAAALKKALGETRNDVSGGISLSAAMAKHDKVFPRLMIAM